MEFNLLEVFGYCGSVLVAVSLMMKNILRLRWINLVGASVFSIYGLLVEAYPVFILNGFIAVVDIYYLLQMYKQKDYFSLLPVKSDNKFLEKFFSFHKNDILKFFPNFLHSEVDSRKHIFILRNLLPVGIVVYEKKSATDIQIILDYAIPDYRDLENAQYVFSNESEYFKSDGIKRIIAKSKIPVHIKYLLKVGFEKSIENPDTFYKNL
ncbi:MAG: hypothetical protein JEY94_12140 [Melioribacteraceae bacterium]|nr:hypothetical protein [Melioribacteraceae bacterium]